MLTFSVVAVHAILLSLKTCHTYISDLLQLETGIENPVLLFTEKCTLLSLTHATSSLRGELASRLQFASRVHRVLPCLVY